MADRKPVALEADDWEALPEADDWEALPAQSAPTKPPPATPRKDLLPSAAGNIRDAAEVMGLDGLLPAPGALRGAMANLVGGATFNFGDELAGLRGEAVATTRKLGGRSQKDLDEIYRLATERAQKTGLPLDVAAQEAAAEYDASAGNRAKQGFRRQESQFREENPGTAIALGTAGGMLTGGAVTGGRSKLARYLPAAVEGALSGAGSAEQMEDVPALAVGGAMLGPLAQKTGEMAGNLGGRLMRGIARRTPAAEFLEKQGVKGLTTGQLNPDSALAQLEEASTSVGGVGPAIQAQRQASRDSWQDVVLGKAVAPGQQAPTQGALPDRLEAVYQGYAQAYAPARGVPVVPVTSSGAPLRPTPNAPSAFDAVVSNPQVLATPEQRRVVDDFLKNQLGLIPPQVGPISSDVLVEMRSNIRAAARDAAQGGDRRVAELLGGADAVVTDALESQLPPDAVSAIRAADAAYGRFKTVENAVGRAGDRPSGLTPNDLAQALRANQPKGKYARGGGGELRGLARAGREVFDARSPTTGARLLTTGPFGWAVAPLSYAANTPGVQRVLLGETPFQQAGASLLEQYTAPFFSSATRSAYDTSISEEDAQRSALVELLRKKEKR